MLKNWLLNTQEEKLPPYSLLDEGYSSQSERSNPRINIVWHCVCIRLLKSGRRGDVSVPMWPAS
jgi:hypothetical protein